MKNSLLSISPPRLMAALAALLMLATLIPAHAQSFGRTTVGTIPSAGLRADFLRGSKFSVTEGATITELCAYLDGQGGGNVSQNVRLVVYRDVNGVPGTKVGGSITQTIAAGAAANWRCLKTPYLVLDTVGDYWIMLHSGGNTGVVRYYYDGAANWYGGTDAFADDAAETFGAGGTGTGTLSVYAAYASFDNLRNVGRTTVGTIASGGLRANYKRGSSYTQEQGRAVALSVYMDGLGGGAGTHQDLTFALYQEDPNTGNPGTRSIVTETISIPAGMRPQWITVPLPPHVLYAPGGFLTHWFIIHSGSDAGIARYYYDGTGNWCGHADTFSDGTDQNFGSCDAGNGTISAFLSFEPGRFDNGPIVGNQADPSTATPSSGLSANFIRGSKFTVTAERASLGFVRAYMDGLGGAAGSQQVQVLVYDNSPGHKLVAESAIGTINAGTQPSWNLFLLKKPVLLPPGDYYLMLFTGGAAGVARNFATSTPNWIGIGANFAAGPPAILDPPPANVSTGTVTLLMYAELTVPLDEEYY